MVPALESIRHFLQWPTPSCDDSDPSVMFTFHVQTALHKTFGREAGLALVPQMVDNLAVESADSAADLVNAIGRLHTLPDLDQYKREDLEAQVCGIVNWYTCLRADVPTADAL